MPDEKPLSAESEYVPVTPAELSEEEAKDVLKLVDTCAQDDEVQKVFHNLASDRFSGSAIQHLRGAVAVGSPTPAIAAALPAR